MVLLSGMEQESCLCQGRAGHGFWQKKRAGEDDGWDQQASSSGSRAYSIEGGIGCSSSICM